jgi:hypothetical protein
MNSTKEAAEQVEKEADQHLNGKERSEEEKRESNGKGNPKAISEWLDRRRGVR